MASGAYNYDDDPKHMVFTLARYKFVARMFQGKDRVLEVGCGEGWKSRIVRQAVNHLVAIDSDPALIETAKRNNSEKWPIEFRVADACDITHGNFNGAYCIDLLEHLNEEDEEEFLGKLRFASPVSIIGIPSLESQQYANRPEHINCKTGEELRKKCREFWRQVFIFSMNDEVLHTGYFPMSHYLFALCIS